MRTLRFAILRPRKHCIERFVSAVDSGASCCSIEDSDVITKLQNHDTIVFGFPVYYSNIPKIAKDFITENKSVFNGKKVYIITTKGLHNAFGIGYARRMFNDCGAEFIGSSQFNMPDNIRDIKIMEAVFDYSKDGKIIEKADRKIIKAAERFKANKPQKNGLNPYSYIAGFFFKILWFYPKTNNYITAPKVNIEKCNGCRKCVKLCPMQNISIVDNKAVSGGKCTVCYRCMNNCSKKALTILGNKVCGQYDFEKVLK